MEKPFLSICIPTYNRSSCLKECLSSVTEQWIDPAVRDAMEIVISDNASTDDTTKMVAEFQKSFSNIKYFKNEKNVGFDRNILNAVDNSSGEYCLTFGDDDAFFSNAFAGLLKKLRTINVPYMMLNCWGYDHALQHQVVSHANRETKEDIMYEKLSDFVPTLTNYADLVGSFGGMSVQLFKRQAWMDFPHKDKYIGTSTIHLFIILSVFKDQPFALLAEPVVKTRNDNIRWDTYPGFETHKKRSRITADAALWISNLYGLSLSPFRVAFSLQRRGYVLAFKGFIKKILYRLGLRKQQPINHYMQTILLTGGTGFLGSKIAETFLNAGHRVVLLTRKNSSMLRLSAIVNHPELRLFNLEDQPIETCFSLHKIVGIVHAATCYGRDNESWPEIAEANLILPLRLLVAGERNGTRCFINADTFFNEKMVFSGNEAYYVKTKKHFLDIAEHAVKTIRIKFFNMRIEQMFGPDDNAKKFIPFIINTLLSESGATPLTPGEQKRDFVYVDDVAKAFLSAFEHADTLGSFIQFGIGHGRSASIKELIKYLKETVGSTAELQFGKLPYRDNEIMDSFADTRNNARIEWKAETDWKDGLKQTMAFYQKK